MGGKDEREISKPGKNRGFESCSNLVFPLVTLSWVCHGTLLRRNIKGLWGPFVCFSNRKMYLSDITKRFFSKHLVFSTVFVDKYNFQRLSLNNMRIRIQFYRVENRNLNCNWHCIAFLDSPWWTKCMSRIGKYHISMPCAFFKIMPNFWWVHRVETTRL